MDGRNNAAASASEHEFQAKLLRLIELSKKPRLDNEQERNERDELLRYFRRNGYTSAGISKLTGGNLKEDTIKRIIKGVQIDDDSLKKRVAELIGDVVMADLGLDDVRTSVSIKNALPEDIGVGDVSSFLADAQQSPDVIGGVKGVLSMYRGMREQKVSFAQVKEMLHYKEESERAGIKVQHLQKISEVAKKYKKGDVNQLMDALSSFDSLESLKEEVKKEEELLEEATKKRQTAEKDAKIAIAENTHRREAIAICKDLITRYGFTTAGLNDISELAKKCGNPTEVMNALAGYNDIKDLSAQKNRLSSEVKVLQDAVDNLKGQQEAIRNSITGLLNPILNEITKAFTDGAKQMADEYDKQIADMKEASVEYGRRQEAAAYLADDLKLVKIIRTITTYPEEAIKIPIGFAVVLLTAAKNILIAKGNHSKIKKRYAMLVPGHNYEADRDIEALVLVNGAIMALESVGATAVDA
jgi:phenylpyruvate tautomerase PptA (4-oxalocrotonate tautomerase family)